MMEQNRRRLRRLPSLFLSPLLLPTKLLLLFLFPERCRWDVALYHLFSYPPRQFSFGFLCFTGSPLTRHLFPLSPFGYKSSL